MRFVLDLSDAEQRAIEVAWMAADRVADGSREDEGWPPWQAWHREILEDYALSAVAPDVVRLALEDDWIGSPSFERLVTRMTTNRLFREGVLDALLAAMPRP